MKQNREEPKTKRHKVEPILCPRCKGKGAESQQVRMGQEIVHVEYACTICKGEGYIEE